MNPQDIKRALVVGAGVMGHSMAQVMAAAGVAVALVDNDPAALAKAKDLIASDLATLARAGEVPPGELEAIAGRISYSGDLAAAAEGIEFAIEAVVEVLAVKQEVFSVLDRHAPAEAVLASNTSSLDVLSQVKVARPQRLVYAHWFAPPHIVPLVEIAPGPHSDQAVVDFTAGLMRRLGKRPVVLRRFVPSFIVNRIQAAISSTVLDMLAEGWVSPQEIDLAVKTSLGVRLPVVGVVQNMDFGGLDLYADIQRAAKGQVHPVVADKVAKGHLGAKSGRGMYVYGGRGEAQITAARDERYLKVLALLKEIKAFEPV